MGTFVSSRQVSQGIYLQTPWWLSGASIDLDFDQQRYYDSSLGGSASLAPLNNYISVSRASTGYAQNSAGTWIAFGNDTLRITDKGLLAEGARTNYLLNSGTPATQTTSSLSTGNYTLWVNGSGSALASAGSATITGAASATDGAPDTFTVTVAGTVTVTVTGSLTRFQLEAGDFAGSYIPTMGATATRAEDLISFSGTLNTILISAGSPGASLFIDYLRTGWRDGAAQNDYMSLLGQSTFNAALLLVREIGPPPEVNNNMSALLPATIGGSALLTGGVKVATSWSSTGVSVVGGGGTVATTSFTSNDVALPRLGYRNLSFQGWGYYRRLTVWNSKIADATLQSLTVP